MPNVYIYRGEVITYYKNGWMGNVNDPNIYKTIDDAKNAIDKQIGGYPPNNTGEIPKRCDKPIRIVGQWTDEDTEEQYRKLGL